MLDLLVRGGTVIDGTGAPRATADVGIRGGRIAAVGRVDEPARRTLDADGLWVTPGWVDVHTHYDGQVTWDSLLTPSCWHGVTTVVMGNCGVGFAPVRPGSHEYLIKLMEGVEDIPGTALAEGIRWEWESFPEYLDAVERIPHALDVGAQVPHAALRFYVMGERGADHEELPTRDEIDTMGRLVREAVRAGALGFTTSRTRNHRASDGRLTPSLTATADELIGISRRFGEAGAGVFEIVSDFPDPRGRVEAAARDGVGVGAPDVGLASRRTTPRPTPGAPCSPSSSRRMRPACRCAVRWPRARSARCSGSRRRSIRSSATRAGRESRRCRWRRRWRACAIRSCGAGCSRNSPRPRCACSPTRSGSSRSATRPTTSRRARRASPPRRDAAACRPTSCCSTCCSRTTATPCSTARCSTTPRSISTRSARCCSHPLTVPGLGDAGAHCGLICDGSFPTYLLLHWGRARTRGAKLPVEQLVKRQTADTAALVGLLRPRRARARQEGGPEPDRPRCARARAPGDRLRPARGRKAPGAARARLPRDARLGRGGARERRADRRAAGEARAGSAARVGWAKAADGDLDREMAAALPSLHLIVPPGAAPGTERLVLARAIRGAVDGFASLVLVAYLADLGFSPAEVGALVTATLLGSAAAHARGRARRRPASRARRAVRRVRADAAHGTRLRRLLDVLAAASWSASPAR